MVFFGVFRHVVGTRPEVREQPSCSNSVMKGLSGHMLNPQFSSETTYKSKHGRQRLPQEESGPASEAAPAESLFNGVDSELTMCQGHM